MRESSENQEVLSISFRMVSRKLLKFIISNHKTVFYVLFDGTAKTIFKMIILLAATVSYGRKLNLMFMFHYFNSCI